MSFFFDRIYPRLPLPAQNAAISLAGSILHRRRYGGDCRQQAEFLRESQWWDADALQELRDKRWRQLVAEVLPGTPHYADVLRRAGIDPQRAGLEDLQRFPLLEKRVLREEGHRLLQGGTPRRGLFRSSTSGTTGSPITLYSEHATERAYYAYYLRLMSWMGTEMGETRATFHGRTLIPITQKEPPFWRYDRSENSWQFSSFHLAPHTLQAYIEKLHAIQPVEVRGYPSSLITVARALERLGSRYPVRPRAVHTTAETLLPQWRRELEAAFAAPVFDVYGSSEKSHLVTTCEKGTHHVNPEFGIVEILVDGERPARPGESGEVVCTSFVNRTQPLVRYRVGDSATFGDQPCACGRAFPVMLSIQGRLDDFVVTPAGRMVGRLDPVFKGSGGIRECQIVQDRKDRLRLRLVRGPDFRPEHLDRVREELGRRVGPEMEIVVEEMEEIPKGPNGKFRSVVRAPGIAPP